VKRWSFSPEADADLFEVWMYLLLEVNIEIANRIEAEIYGACDLLAEQPMAGSLKPEWTTRPVRFWLVGNC
jgi:plasmid stabilization system protein ParE